MKKITGLYCLLVGLVFLFACKNVKKEIKTTHPPIVKVKVKEKNSIYGFDADSFQVTIDTIEKNWTLSHVFLPYGVHQARINEVARLAKDSLDFKYVKKGKRFYILENPTSDSLTKGNVICIYEKSAIEYLVFDFRNKDSIGVKKIQKEIKTRERRLEGIIVKNSNLSNSISEQVNSPLIAGELSEYMADVFAWSIDFFRINPNDRYSVIYEEQYVDSTLVGVGEVKALVFYHHDNPYYAFHYQSKDKLTYFDEDGNGMKRLFLKAPIKFRRISSGFTMRRYHPVQKRWKAHLGTDYAAARGTPIWATADGVVEKATYSKFNGNYVKIRHNRTYKTAYLHMTRRAKGMKPGKRVRQGDVIGYVGSTGLATGAHVCYRFWKNGRQVNPRKQKFEPAEPISKDQLTDYINFIIPLKKRLDKSAQSEKIEV